MKTLPNIQQEATQRWEKRTTVRNNNAKEFSKTGIASVESPERIQLRFERLKKINHSDASTILPPREVIIPNLAKNISMERVLGKPDFLGTDFLEMGLAVSRFVGRINIKNEYGRHVGFGTGFMVSPQLMLTNNHVLPDLNSSQNSQIEFDYQHDRFGQQLPVETFQLKPDTFFMTAVELDFTLIAVEKKSYNGTDLSNYGWCRLIEEQGKALYSDPLNIVQHPLGEIKQLVLRSNELIDLFDDFAHYTTDTQPGSSGAPVFNDQWEVIALHHSGIPRTLDGQYLDKDGNIWEPGMDPDRLDWVANEGIRVSSLVKYIKSQPLSESMNRLRLELLESKPPHPFAMAAKAQQEKGTLPIHGINPIPQPLSINLPLTITFTPGNNQVELGINPSQDEKIISTTHVQKNAVLSKRLTRLAANKDLTYYDEEEDQINKESYYQDVKEILDSQQFYTVLNDLITSTHTTQLDYGSARHDYLYTLVDLQPNSMLKSIYTGQEYPPEQIVEEEFLLEEQFRQQLMRQLGNMEYLNGAILQQHMDAMENTIVYNAEHVVPQSWFDKKNPMRADLHHLFTCEPVCNSFRSNIPYDEFPDYQEVVRKGCGKREENRFEPAQGHGVVARATLYFLIRYPGEINNNGDEYQLPRIETLINWHQQYPVTLFERHRNAEIFKIQGNRNPLIDFPDWVEKISFKSGLGQ